MSEPRRPRTESELIELVRSSDVRAPEALHQRVQALVSERSTLPWRRRIRTGRAQAAGGDGEDRLPDAGRPPAFGAARSAARRPARVFAWRLGAAVALAALAGALVAGLTGGGSSTLSLRQTSALTLRPATRAAPSESASNRDELTAAVDGVAFPYWEDHFGWHSVGARSDRVGGRTVTTVFYGDGRGRRIGYAIVSGATAPPVSGGMVTWSGGSPYRLLSVNGVQVVSWLRGGHLCVVSGRGVDSATLLRLASWTDSGLAA